MVPNLRGASPVGRGVRGRAYAARAISRVSRTGGIKVVAGFPARRGWTVISGGTPWGCRREMGLGTQGPRVIS